MQLVRFMVGPMFKVKCKRGVKCILSISDLDFEDLATFSVGVNDLWSV